MSKVNRASRRRKRKPISSQKKISKKRQSKTKKTPKSFELKLTRSARAAVAKALQPTPYLKTKSKTVSVKYDPKNLEGRKIPIKLRKHNFSRGRTVTGRRGKKELAALEKTILKEAEKFFKAHAGKDRRFLNIRIAMNYRTKTGDTIPRIINKRRIKTNRLESFQKKVIENLTFLREVIAGRNKNTADSRPSNVASISIKNFAFEVQDEEVKNQKKSTTKKNKKNKNRSISALKR